MSTAHNNGKKVCIFVDGENLRHSIVDLFPPPIFNEWDYLPKNANWTKFFDFIACEVAGVDAHRIRTYWYVVANLDCTPFNLGKAEKDPSLLESILQKHRPWADDLDRIKNTQDRSNRMRDMLASLKENKRKMQGRFDGWIYLQNQIASEHTAIEFRRAGAIKFNLFEKKLGQEKAVDVKLAVDLVRLKDIYDVAVIVSGDQDYVPAVEAVKDHGKRLVNVTFLKSNGALLPGGAVRLNYATDSGLSISHSDLKIHLNL